MQGAAGFRSASLHALSSSREHHEHKQRPTSPASKQPTPKHTRTPTARRRPAGLRLGASKIGSRIMKLNKHARMRARQRVRGESYAQVASDYGVPPQRELGGEGANGFERLMDAVAVQCCFPSMVTPCTPLRPQSTCNFIRAETPGQILPADHVP